MSHHHDHTRDHTHDPLHLDFFPGSRRKFWVGYVAIFAVLSIAVLLSTDFERKSIETIDVGVLSNTIGVQKKAKKTNAKATAKENDENKPSSFDINIAEKDRTANDYDDGDAYRNDLSYYNPLHWKNPPRIVILSGPHKTASSTLQDFVMNITGSTVSLSSGKTPKQKNKLRKKLRMRKRARKKLEAIRPHSDITDWVYPVGVPEDFYPRDSIAGGLTKVNNPSKFYSRLASYISGRRRKLWFRDWRQKNKSEREAMLEQVRDYFQRIFWACWQREKNLVIAAEAFDTLVESLAYPDGSLGATGEDLHLAANSGSMIDALLDVLPWDNDNDNKNSAGNSNRRPPLQMEDIEIHIHLRRPRIKHTISIWHQLGKKKTLRKFLTKDKSLANLYQSNSLALALQYVKRGIKTTLVDMKGVFEDEKLSPNETTNTSEDTEKSIGGLQAVLACDVLRLGSSKSDSNNKTASSPQLCDGDGRLHLQGWYKPEHKNKKEDLLNRRLTDDQLDEIDSLLNEYDCGVWKHLETYRSKGLLRILYPSDDLLATCGNTDKSSDNNDNARKDISFHDVLQRIKKIANRESPT